MQLGSFNWLAGEVGWTGNVRAAMELREVDAMGDPDIALQLGVTEAEVRALVAEAEAQMQEWQGKRSDLAESLEHWRTTLQLARNRRRIHTGRTSGPGKTGRDGKGDLGREVVPGMVDRSPFPSEWDLVSEPPDSPHALPPRQRQQQRLAQQAESREREQARQERQARPDEPPRPKNRRERRALKFGNGKGSP